MTCTRQTISVTNDEYPAGNYFLRRNINSQKICENVCLQEENCKAWLFYNGNKCKTATNLNDEINFKEEGVAFGRVECTQSLSFSGIAMFIFIVAILVIAWVLISCRINGDWRVSCS